jgi:hypothetical protein
MTIPPPKNDKTMTAAHLFGAVVIAVFGAVVILLPLVKGPPNVASLVPVEGMLVSYSVHRGNSGNSSLFSLFHLRGHTGRFWNDAAKNGSAHRLDGHIGETVRVMYDPHGHFTPIDGDAVKSYGLWIGGVEIVSASDAVNTDRLQAYVVLPALGLLCVGMGFHGLRKWRREQERSAQSIE